MKKITKKPFWCEDKDKKPDCIRCASMSPYNHYQCKILLANQDARDEENNRREIIGEIESW